MITVQYKGRLGNNLIQYAAGYILAKKSGQKLHTPPRVSYINYGRFKTSSSDEHRISINFGKVFDIEQPPGETFEQIAQVNDYEYRECLNRTTHATGYNLSGFFQHPSLLCKYRDEILDLYSYDNNHNNIDPDDAFIACRFGDVMMVNRRKYCSIQYVEQHLIRNRHKYNNVYLTSDSLDHPPLVELIEKYNITKYSSDPLMTILFAKCFNNLILSAGSFSYWMAYLSVAKNISVFHEKQDGLITTNSWKYNPDVNFYIEN